MRSVGLKVGSSVGALLLFGGIVVAGSYTGRWEGTTSQGLGMAVVVNDFDHVERVEFIFKRGSCNYGLAETLARPIRSGGSFTADLEASNNSATFAFRGEISGAFCGNTLTGNWRSGRTVTACGSSFSIGTGPNFSFTLNRGREDSSLDSTSALRALSALTGHWSGSTAQGLPISIDIDAGGAISGIDTSYAVTLMAGGGKLDLHLFHPARARRAVGFGRQPGRRFPSRASRHHRTTGRGDQRNAR